MWPKWLRIARRGPESFTLCLGAPLKKKTLRHGVRYRDLSLSASRLFSMGTFPQQASKCTAIGQILPESIPGSDRETLSLRDARD